MKILTIYNIVCSTALIDVGEQVLYLKLNQYNKIVSKKICDCSWPYLLYTVMVCQELEERDGELRYAEWAYTIFVCNSKLKHQYMHNKSDCERELCQRLTKA